ncbi:MAG: prepilin peptidase [Candidatus Lernaella stagnicola]|nr:prepilin peptidase [Candidatus Lernaella stagnicola]
MYADNFIQIYVTFAGFLFGAAIGSFLNVVIWRLPQGESIVFPGSHCPQCGNAISWYDNIPLLSWVFLGAKCRHCRGQISLRYPMVELVSAIFLAGYLNRFGIAAGVVWYLFTAALIVVTMIDLDHKIIPDEISLPGIPIGLLINMFVLSDNWKDGLIDGGLGALLGGGLLLAIALGYYALTKTEGMGLGDPKLLGMIGAFVGWKGVIFTILVSSLVGTLIGALFIALTGKSRKFQIPFGPFLALGAVTWVWLGPAAVRWYFGY